METIQYHEKDFLIAYKGHMSKVYKDLDQMKLKVSEQNVNLRKDQRVQKL
jgi:hypothetical protein